MVARRSKRRERRVLPDARRRRFKAVAISGIVLALVALIALDHSGLLAAPRSDSRRYDGVPTRILRVIDGDTVIVDRADLLTDKPSTRVRLWGIDSPELARHGAPAQPFAEEAARFARDRLDGATVTLILEPSRLRGRYGRLLAHLRMQDGEFFSLKILRAGLARNDTRWPHRWMAEYKAAEQSAQTAGVGLWAKRKR